MSMPLLVLVVVILALFIAFGFTEYLDARADIALSAYVMVTDVYRSYVGLLIGVGSLVAFVDVISTFVMR